MSTTATPFTMKRDLTVLLRQWLAADAAPNYTDAQLQRVLGTTEWDADLAYTALTMTPRPLWTQRIIA